MPKVVPVEQQYNRLPRPTFRWMEVNFLPLDPLAVKDDPALRPDERHEGDVTVDFYRGNKIPEIKDFTGANPESLAPTLSENSNGISITVPDGKAGKVWLDFTINEVAPQYVGQVYIKAGHDSKLDVYMSFNGGSINGLVNVFEYVEAGDNATVSLNKVQVNGQDTRHIEHRYAKAGESSTVNYISAELGGHKTLVYYKNDLDHDNSTFNSHAMYIGNNDQVFDFSYWVPTSGVKTNTDILTTGALLDTSKKYFRGTIDFLRGGKKAVGNESDVCLLLSPKVHSISLPLLLCKEDDVVGNHASSAGQIDKDKLFYLMSRGFNEDGAQLIIVESNIRPVIDKLGDELLMNKALQAVRSKMDFCETEGECSDKCAKRFPNLN